ncbi:MAG: hypothetical protein C0482_18545 [Gordonia sp.]|uniref:Uncharacterized protein n=1 Tax=Gordonia rubripertincta TaxID=36822 RepID=A0ABT4N412_GORRU|nr:hypothetical protein [Gordonia rubripertincta]MBA4024358.1 hypothetical protein [Gordonia sp. (in: high G+C Gram-positive bacteria)]MCZ4553141.1 hypothetical protein [Gordonia rubripertincta]
MSRHVKSATAAALTTIALSGALMVGAGPASAAKVYPTADNQVLIVELTHEETVAASQVGAGNVINAVLGNDHWGVILETDSRYQGDSYFRPEKARTWSNVTGQQVVSEAAAHRGGRVVFGVYPQTPDVPLWVMQDW